MNKPTGGLDGTLDAHAPSHLKKLCRDLFPKILEADKGYSDIHPEDVCAVFEDV